MIIRFNEDLSEQAIFANGAELAQVMGKDKDEEGKRVHSWPEDKEEIVAIFEDPVLITDNYKISQLPGILRDTVFALFSSPVRITEYGETSLRFEQKEYPGVWGPSIDTLLFCKAINPEINPRQLLGVKTAAEIGCGSGFISKYVLQNAPDLEHITLIDLNEHAIQCAMDNIKDTRAEFAVGNGIELIKDKRYDLIICNPPYIPRPSSIDDNPYEGISLLYYLISNPHEHLTDSGSVITNISSLCKRIANRAFTKSIAVTYLDCMAVPLKVFNVLNNEKWMNFLLESNGLNRHSNNGYDYWHTISITKITPISE